MEIALNRTWLSCGSFAAKAIRLQLHALAYGLGRFLKTGAKVVGLACYPAFQIGDGHFTRPVHGHLADDRGASAAASHINSVALLVVTSSIETTGEARLEDAFFPLETAMRLYWVTNALIHSPSRHDDYTQMEYSIPSD